MVDWYPDPALARFIAQWKAKHPNAIVYTIGDEFHDATSQHVPEADGSVDAGDVMPGGGVDQQELDDLAETLRLNRDPRILYVIRRQRIFSGATGSQPFMWRPYGGTYHGHLHLSVGDAHEGKPVTDWDLTPPEGEDMPTLQEIQTAVWMAESAEYYDVDDDGTRQKRTRVDILHRAEAAAQRANEAAVAAVALAQQAVDDTAAIRQLIHDLDAQQTANLIAARDEILARLPAPPPVEP